jgi:hypothetical protein
MLNRLMNALGSILPVSGPGQNSLKSGFLLSIAAGQFDRFGSFAQRVHRPDAHHGAQSQEGEGPTSTRNSPSSVGTNRIVTRVSKKPRLVCRVRAVPVYSL